MLAEARQKISPIFKETIEQAGENLDNGIDSEAMERLQWKSYLSFSQAVSVLQRTGGMLSSMKIMFSIALSKQPRSPADASALTMEWTSIAENLVNLGDCFPFLAELPGCERMYDDLHVIMQRRHANSHCWLRIQGQLYGKGALLNTEEKRHRFFKKEIWDAVETCMNPLFVQVETLFRELSTDLHVRLMFDLGRSKQFDIAAALKRDKFMEGGEAWEGGQAWEGDEACEADESMEADEAI
jgi:hypothetical protein